jgi:hypothetical protein
LIKNNVEIRYSKKNLTYGPHPSGGKPGIITITDDASITALIHEAQHFYDDLAKGFPGWEVLLEPKTRWQMEFNAYLKEVAFLKKNKEFEIAKKLLDNAKAEKEYIEDIYKIKL